MENTPETKKGYNGYFPKNAVIEYHRQSFGIINGKAAIIVSIKNGEYNGFEIMTKKRVVDNAE